MSQDGNSIDKKFYDEFMSALRRNDPSDQIEASFYSYHGYVRNMCALGKGFDDQLYNHAEKEFYSWKNKNDD